MGQKRVGQVDLNAGLLVLVPPKKRNGFGERWLAVGQDPAELIAQKRKELGAEGYSVLFMLMSKLNFENLLSINQAELGRQLGLLRQNVQRAIKNLKEVGVLLEGPKDGHNRSYRLNPEFGWKGSAKNHVKALGEHRKKRMKALGQAKSQTTAPEAK